MPRQRKISRRIDHGSNDHTFLSTEECFRQQHFEALDTLICQLDQRFDQRDLKVLEEIEKLSIGCCNNSDMNPSEELMELYQREIIFQNLQVQLAMLPDFLKTCNEENTHETSIKQVTLVNTICELMNISSFGKTKFSEVNKLLHLYLTVPMTSSTAERSFPALRRIKDYLRSTMTQARPNHLKVTHVHKDRTDNLNIVDIAKAFISLNDRQSAFFGHFK